MKKLFLLFFTFITVLGLFSQEKREILIIQSYHREYHVSTLGNTGVLNYFLEVGYLDSPDQITTFIEHDEIETSRLIIRELWMDSKRKNSKDDLQSATRRLIKEIEEIKPDLIMLGDDNTVKYIGNYLLDSDYPIVFWGVNGLPTKYPAVDSISRPGHNVTGIYQSNYTQDALDFFKKIFPNIKRISIISDASPTGKAWNKQMEKLILEQKDHFTLTTTVVSNNYSKIKSQILTADKNTDLFIVGPHFTIKNQAGDSVTKEFVDWYLTNINKPEIVPIATYLKEGFLCTVNDDIFKQGYEAAKLVYRILEEGEDPAQIRTTTPTRGNFILNTQRAKDLNLYEQFRESGYIEQYFE